MTTPSQEEIQEILAPLDAYYAATPLEFSIGLQNFQSIRQYTKIPLSPITLIYGQNSAGKSAIQDALIFIHDFLGGKLSSYNYCRSLDRWASRQRIARPLSKGYIGKPADTIISINAWGMGMSSEYTASLSTKSSDILLSLLRENSTPTFSLRFHFSENIDSTDDSYSWYIREFSLILGEGEFIHYECNNKSEKIEDAFCSINKKHPLFTILGQLLEQPLDEVAINSEFYNGEICADDNWLKLKDIRMNFEGFEWLNDEFPVSLEHYNALGEDIHKAEVFRDLITGIIKLVSISASNFANIETVPPLRPVPTKNESCFRLSSSAHENDTFQPWKRLAIDIRDKEFYYLWERLQPNKSHFDYLKDQDSDRLINYVNHVLQHDFFLEAGYEVTGECEFLLSAKNIEDIQNDVNDDFFYYAHVFASEVRLRLNSISDKFPVEIEDVGVGISQIIPVLCAIYDHCAETYIHQPELHLHPKMQSQLGDLFIDRINDDYEEGRQSQYSSRKSIDRSIKQLSKLNGRGKHLFIETHSEHILLRILRRIRETNRSDIRHKLFGFTAEQLCVLYVDKDENGDSQVIQLRVAENGEFIDRWPHGFFTERDEDLFDE